MYLKYIIPFHSWLHGLVEPPWLHGLVEPPWLHDLVEPPWFHDLVEPPWLHDLVEPPWLHDLVEPPWSHSLALVWDFLIIGLLEPNPIFHSIRVVCLDKPTTGGEKSLLLLISHLFYHVAQMDWGFLDSISQTENSWDLGSYVIWQLYSCIMLFSLTFISCCLGTFTLLPPPIPKKHFLEMYNSS